MIISAKCLVITAEIITFTPDGFGQRYTDPSYHIPAFYEVWARWADDGRSDFRYDSCRVPMNITLDCEWSCADGEWQRQYGETIQNFFYSQGVDTFVDQYRTDGTLPEGDEILQAGGFRKLRHSIGLVGTVAASMLCSHDKSKAFVDALWHAKHEPFDDGYFDAYYDGLLRLFAFMHLSGNYRIIER